MTTSRRPIDFTVSDTRFSTEDLSPTSALIARKRGWDCDWVVAGVDSSSEMKDLALSALFA